MVVIRLSRGGLRKKPFYKIVVTDSRSPRDGLYLEKVGYFDPLSNDNNKKLKMDCNRINYWTKCGAQLSDRVRKLMMVYKNILAHQKSTPCTIENME